MTLKELRKRAEEFDATIVIGEYNAYDQSTTIEVEAPDGKQWSACNAQVLVAYSWAYAKGSRAEAYDDLAERMTYGLEDYTEE